MEFENKEKDCISADDKTRIVPITLDRHGCALIPKESPLTATLMWHGRDGRKAGDLDFYCFYVTAKGDTGKIYYRNMGDTGNYPYLALLGDSKDPGEEVIVIERPEELKYVLFAAYSAAENGVGSFYSYNAYLVLQNRNNVKVVAPLLDKNENSYWVAIASLDFTKQEDAVEVKQVEKYSAENEERSPVLKPDGSILMDSGDVEFKAFELNLKK